MALPKKRAPKASNGLPADMFMKPLTVRSGIPSSTISIINEAVASKHAERSRNRTARLIRKASKATAAVATVEEAPAGADLSESNLLSEIRDAQRTFRKSDWFQDLDETSQENLLNLVALRLKGQITQSEYSTAVREARASVRGTTAPPAASRNSHHPWKLPFGF